MFAGDGGCGPNCGLTAIQGAPEASPLVASADEERAKEALFVPTKCHNGGLRAYG